MQRGCNRFHRLVGRSRPGENIRLSVFGIIGVRRLLRHPASRRTMFFEAWLYLLSARIALRCLPSRLLQRFFGYPLGKNVPSTAERTQLRQEIGWAIDHASRWLPGDTVCFPKAIAAQIMCRKRGIDTIMYYGAAKDGLDQLVAHVWVQDGADGVIGHVVTERYRVLARYPA